MILLFPSGSGPNSTSCFTFSIIDDFTVEEEESFMVTASGAVFLPNQQATVIISDNDGMPLLKTVTYTSLGGSWCAFTEVE